MTLAEFSAIFAKMCFGFNQDYKEGQMLVYFEQLKGYDFAQLKEIVNKLIGTMRFFPKVAEIKELTEPDITARAEVAWQHCYASACNAGRTPITSDEARALNAIGGMIALRDADVDTGVHWLRKEYIDAYKNLKYSDIRVSDCQGLTGGIGDGDLKLVEVAPEIKRILEHVGKSMPGVEKNGQ